MAELRRQDLDRLGLRIGVGSLAVLAALYPVVASSTGRPLAVFVLPALLAGAVAGWRTTALVAAASSATGVVIGVVGPLSPSQLLPRVGTIVVGSLAAVVAAYVRDLQQLRGDEAEETARISASFQEGLLRTTDAPDGFLVEVRYQPGEKRMRLGGDFYDVATRSDGSVAFIVGDVCGHGPTEAALGATLRSAWRPLALRTGSDPREWLTDLETAFVAGDAPYVTACAGLIDPDGTKVRFVCAGHPWPILLDEQAELIKATPGRPLGLSSGRPRPLNEMELGGTAGLLVYTDGITEAPLQGLGRRVGEAGLLGWLNDRNIPARVSGADLDALLDGRAVGPLELIDDVALLLITQKRAGGQGGRLSPDTTSDAGTDDGGPTVLQVVRDRWRSPRAGRPPASRAA